MDKNSPPFEVNYQRMFSDMKRGTSHCVCLEDLDLYLAGKLSRREHEHITRHLENCDKCTVQLNQLQAFLKDEESVLDAKQWERAKRALNLQLEELLKTRSDRALAPSTPETLMARWLKFWRPWILVPYRQVLLAYFLCLGVSFAIYYFRDTHWGQRGFLEPTVTERRIEKSDKIKVIQPMEKVNQTSLIFEWAPVPNADYYIVEIYTSSLENVWTSAEILRNKTSLPMEIVGQLQPGKAYLWKVQAFTKNKKPIKDSRVQSFEVVMPNS
jgi:hypothetical protein